MRVRMGQTISQSTVVLEHCLPGSSPTPPTRHFDRREDPGDEVVQSPYGACANKMPAYFAYGLVSGAAVFAKALILSISTMLSAGICAARGLQRAFSKDALRNAFHSWRIGSSCKVLNQSRNHTLENPRSFSSSEVRMDPQKLREEWGTPSFEVMQMTHLLDHDNHEKRAKFRKVLSEDPLFTPKYNISLDEERELALKRLKKLCDQGFISVLDFKNNPLWIFAAHELVAVVDAAMATKMTVQFNLFGGTVLKLGTERHHEKLLKVRLKL